MVRAASTPDRDQRRRPGLRPRARGPCSRSRACRCRPERSATSASSSRSRRTSARSSTSTRWWSGTATTSSSTSSASRACGGGRSSSSAGARRAGPGVGLAAAACVTPRSRSRGLRHGAASRAALSVRYEPVLAALMSPPVVWALLAAVVAGAARAGARGRRHRPSGSACSGGLMAAHADDARTADRAPPRRPRLSRAVPAPIRPPLHARPGSTASPATRYDGGDPCRRWSCANRGRAWPAS